MQISYLGEAGFRIQLKDANLVIDPPAASTGFKPPRQAADIVLITQADERDASSTGGDPMMIDQPGEFERKNVFVYGLHLPSDAGRTHWRIEAEELSLGHIADLNHGLENGDLAQLEGVDILFLPVGGKNVLDAERAAKLMSQIEPRIVVPMQYKTGSAKIGYSGVEPFLKEVGAKNVEPLAKWKILKKDLPAEETQVIVLSVE